MAKLESHAIGLLLILDYYNTLECQLIEYLEKKKCNEGVSLHVGLINCMNFLSWCIVFDY